MIYGPYNYDAMEYTWYYDTPSMITHNIYYIISQQHWLSM